MPMLRTARPHRKHTAGTFSTGSTIGSSALPNWKSAWVEENPAPDAGRPTCGGACCLQRQAAMGGSTVTIGPGGSGQVSHPLGKRVRTPDDPGFTLVELLVAVALLAVTVSAAVPAFT